MLQILESNLRIAEGMVIEILESNLRAAEAIGDTRAAEQIRRSIEFFKARANAQNDNCTEQKA